MNMEAMTFSLSEKSSERISDLLSDFPVTRLNTGEEVIEVSAVFDIEVSSFYSDGEKRSCMYCFVLGLNGKTVIGRTWNQAMEWFKDISDFYKLNKDRRLLIYVHNLSYEFQFIRKRFDWVDVFSNEQRQPLKAVTATGIEFRCSYRLSGYSLATVGKHLTKYPVAKMVGDLDYSKVRGPETPMTEKELGYVRHDGLVVMSYIEELMEEEGSITKIPLTKTGYVRRYCRRECLYSKKSHRKADDKYFRYRRLMKSMTISSVQEYQQLKRAFQGGFTHANPFYSGRTETDVTSYDFTSSYPTVMVSEKFPMGKGTLVKLKSGAELWKYLRCYCCLMDCTFEGLESVISFEHYISLSKCWGVSEYSTDNGRVVSAKTLSITLTEQDFFIIRKTYKWDNLSVRNLRIYGRGYLPKDFVLSILSLYGKKTTLKGVKGSEKEYQNSKERLNSCYGMTVTDICRPETVYDNEAGWSSEDGDFKTQLDKYNKSRNRFLFYPWGVWVTAYARRNLWTGIMEMKEDYIYADTDSVKILNAGKHKAYIDSYNISIASKINEALAYNGIDPSMASPKTVKGVSKPMGVWDFDGHFSKFKTLGAKRYMDTDDEGNLSITVSGVNKVKAVPWMLNQGKDPYSMFSEGLILPPEASGRMTLTYIDEETSGTFTDYLGNEFDYDEKSSTHMEGNTYSMSISDEYSAYLEGLREVNIK